MRTALKAIWNSGSYLDIRRLIRNIRPDVVHFHNIFPLISPAAYYAAKAEGVPVVQTLHNYRMVCPGGQLFRKGRTCEECLSSSFFWGGLFYSCYRQSRAATAVRTLMLVLHRLMCTWAHKVDVFIALTEFSRSKFIQGGLPGEKIVVKPNFIESDGAWSMDDAEKDDEIGGIYDESDEKYALFVGRLSQEKGLETLLMAWKKIDIPLKIVGDGPLRKSLAAQCEGLPHVQLLGPKGSQAVMDYMAGASFLVFPSEWYETFGLVAVEAFSKGTPVIASHIGAIAEVVDHNRTGLHFTPGDPNDLADKVRWLLSHPEELSRMRGEVQSEYGAKYTAERNYEMLMGIYEKVKGNGGMSDQ